METQKKKGNTMLISFLYFVQGLVLSFPSVIPLTYSKVPEYSVLSLFAFAYIPFSLKFISAPFIQYYTSVSYGRRKTWIIITLCFISLMIFIMSFFTQQKYMIETAIAFFFVVFATSVQDISTDALGIKQLENPELLSYLQATLQQIGNIFGSLVFMKVISKQFGEYIGLTESILTIPTFFRISSLVIIIPTIYIHFFYYEKTSEQEKLISSKSLLQIYQQYKIFFNIKNQFCRQALFFLLYLQGITFYNCGYTVQLMHSGFSKQKLATIENILIIPLMLATFYLNKLNNVDNRIKVSKINLICRLIVQLFGFFVINLNNEINLTIFMLISYILMMNNYMIDCNIINSTVTGPLAGMYVTILNSSRNLGTNSTLQLQLIGLVGFNKVVYFGFLYQIIVIVFYKRIQSWIKQQDKKKQKQRQQIQKLD